MGRQLCTIITQENEEEQFDGNGVGCYECVSLQIDISRIMKIAFREELENIILPFTLHTIVS